LRLTEQLRSSGLVVGDEDCSERRVAGHHDDWFLAVRYDRTLGRIERRWHAHGARLSVLGDNPRTAMAGAGTPLPLLLRLVLRRQRLSVCTLGICVRAFSQRPPAQSESPRA